mmetsp:Transcript_152481/g.489052  ORF Transcript_152481/g.489052 Transcript_152481/m.489052 type:complete len:95 (+) Transcript_152481:337-621(+)
MRIPQANPCRHHLHTQRRESLPNRTASSKPASGPLPKVRRLQQVLPRLRRRMAFASFLPNPTMPTTLLPLRCVVKAVPTMQITHNLDLEMRAVA